MKILLFDMDGVLLESRGYHVALQETIANIGRLLGFGGQNHSEVNLTVEDIAAFEAAGITSEWDSAAICSALLLTQAWRLDPERRLPVTVGEPPAPALALQTPDFQELIGRLELAAVNGSGSSALERAEQVLCGDSGGRNRSALPPELANRLREFLHSARTIEHSLPMRIFQERVLGSRAFTATYNLPACLQVDSYLERYDRSYLDPATLAGLHGWLQADDQRAAIFTARPSRPPDGLVCPPEAEIGAQFVGLGHLPIIGLGGTTWLEQRRGGGSQNRSGGRNRERYLKPSPVHALAALRLALVVPAVLNYQNPAYLDLAAAALESAARLVYDGQAEAGWQQLAGAEVSVFEDTRGGLLSALAAQERLANSGINLTLHLYGIAVLPAKVQALRAVGGAGYNGVDVVPNLNAALLQMGVIE